MNKLSSEGNINNARAGCEASTVGQKLYRRCLNQCKQVKRLYIPDNDMVAIGTLSVCPCGGFLQKAYTTAPHLLNLLCKIKSSQMWSEV